MARGRLTASLWAPLLLACLLAGEVPAAGGDWPQFLGPRRNGEYLGNDLAATWPGSGPATLWRRPVGQGFAGPVVANGKLILFHRQGDEEVVEALDAASGEPLWRSAASTGYRDDFGFDEGPRATPAVAAGRVFAFGALGRLRCLELETGEVAWTATEDEAVLAEASHDAYRELSRAPILGSTVRAHPAVASGILYARDGDTLVAVDLRPPPA